MWITIKNWLCGNMGTAGDYSYQAMHYITLLAVVTVTGVLLALSLYWRKDTNRSRKLLQCVALFHLGFEILWRLIYLFVNHAAVVSLWPIYPCNLGGILLPVLALTDYRCGKRMFYLFGFLGGCITFALPQGIFCNSVFVFPILKSVLQHTGLLLIPVIEYASGKYRPTLRDMGWVVAGCLVHLVNCEGIVRLLGFEGDYMFFRSGLPFVIPGIPQFITLSVFALIVLTLMCFLCDVKGSVARIRKTLHQ